MKIEDIWKPPFFYYSGVIYTSNLVEALECIDEEINEYEMDEIVECLNGEGKLSERKLFHYSNGSIFNGSRERFLVKGDAFIEEVYELQPFEIQALKCEFAIMIVQKLNAQYYGSYINLSF